VNELALVRRGGQQQQVGRGFSQSLAQAIPGDLIGAAAQPMCLVDDDQIPAGRDKVLEAFVVVLLDLLASPAAARVQRLHGIQGADDLRPGPPQVVLAADPPQGCEIAGDQQAEIFAEVRLHFRDPLGDESFGGDDQRPRDQAPQLPFPLDQSRLDRLAQSHLVGQQASHALAGDGP
jgi:hypothetical protein